MKSCKDCKWVVGDGEFARCEAPQNIKKDPTGFNCRLFRLTFCSTQRVESWFGAIIVNSCGKRGRWFMERNI